jgi:hypothetical protein
LENLIELKKWINHQIPEGHNAHIVVETAIAAKMAADAELINLIKERDILIAVNDQLSDSLNAFNFNNPDRIAKLLQKSAKNQRIDFRKSMEKVGISKNILSIEYDPDVEGENKLISNGTESKTLSIPEVAMRISPQRLHASEILNKLENNSDKDASLQLALTAFTMESLHKMNLRIGKILAQAKAWAKAEGKSEDFYFYVHREDKSPIIIKKILTDGYGIPESRFIINNYDNYNLHYPWSSDKAPMVLVLDDFIGSGQSMADFLYKAEKKLKIESQILPSFHAFAPYSTPKGIESLSSTGKQFIETIVNSAVDNTTYKKLQDRYRFSTGLGYGSNATGISFEYMSPDNNATAFRPFCECWSYPGTIK